MPIYEFKCKKCSAVIEKIIMFAEAEKLDKESPICNTCGSETEKVEYSQSTFQLKGNWFKQGYG